MRGTCLDALNPYGRPSPTVLKNLGFTGNRLVFFDDIRFYWYYYTLRQAGIQVAVVLTSDSFVSSAISQMRSDVMRYARLLDEDVIWIIGNEWNIDGDASYPRGEDNFISYWNNIASAIRAVNPNAILYVGGLFSEPDIIAKLNRVIPNLSPYPTGIDFHLYLNTNDEIKDIISTAKSNFHCETMMGEWNETDYRNIREDQEVLNEVTDSSFFFCYSDGEVSPMGLVTRSGKKKKICVEYSGVLHD